MHMKTKSLWFDILNIKDIQPMEETQTDNHLGIA